VASAIYAGKNRRRGLWIIQILETHPPSRMARFIDNDQVPRLGGQKFRLPFTPLWS